MWSVVVAGGPVGAISRREIRQGCGLWDLAVSVSGDSGPLIPGGNDKIIAAGLSHSSHSSHIGTFLEYLALIDKRCTTRHLHNAAPSSVPVEELRPGRARAKQRLSPNTITNQ